MVQLVTYITLKCLINSVDHSVIYDKHILGYVAAYVLHLLNSQSNWNLRCSHEEVLVIDFPLQFSSDWMDDTKRITSWHYQNVEKGIG